MNSKLVTLENAFLRTDYFLVGEHEASYDSRYLGLFRKEDIVGKFILAARI
jgi:type IV secretory pathway protease TraF